MPFCFGGQGAMAMLIRHGSEGEGRKWQIAQTLAFNSKLSSILISTFHFWCWSWSTADMVGRRTSLSNFRLSLLSDDQKDHPSHFLLSLLFWRDACADKCQGSWWLAPRMSRQASQCQKNDLHLTWDWGSYLQIFKLSLISLFRRASWRTTDAKPLWSLDWLWCQFV